MLPLREVPAVVAAGVVACAVEIGLRTLPLPRVARAAGAPLRRSSAVRPTEAGQPVLGPHGRLQARAVQRVLRHWPFGDTCLRHALVAGHRLRRFRPELVVGVAKVDGTIKAHAWLEIAGGIYDPIGAAHAYLPLESDLHVE